MLPDGMMGCVRSVFGVGRQLLAAIIRDRPFDLAAQLAFWSVLALFPFTIFLLTVIGFIPLHGLDTELMRTVYAVMPEGAAHLVDTTLHEVIGRQRGGLLVVALLGAFWTASGGMSATIIALNRAYEVVETRPFWKVKLLSLALTLGGTLLFIIATIAFVMGPGLGHRVSSWLGLGAQFDAVRRLLRLPVLILATLFLLSCVYSFLPNTRRRFRLVTPGALIAIALWIVWSLLFKAYVSHFDSYAKTYGTLGTAVVLLWWLYLTGLTVILGGEINATLEQHRDAERSV